MSWLAKSIAKTLNKLNVDDEDDDHNQHFHGSDGESSPPKPKAEGDEESHAIDSSQSESPSGRGVKEDLSELTKTLTRQLWGVASFLAPPPSPQISDSTNRSEQFSDESLASDPEISDAAGIAGLRSDFEEIGGKFKAGISKLSSNKTVSEISKIASNFLPFGSDQDSTDEYSVGVGVTEDVLTFARNIAIHPETWMDFPLPDDEDSDDFDMSDAQQEHALAVERLAPRLAALRMELCPGYMSEGCFWKIYFVLLHPRLSKHDAELLSTPEIVEARAMLMQVLQNKTGKSEPDWSGRDASYSKEATNSVQEEVLSVLAGAQSESVPLKTSTIESATSGGVADFETEKHPVPSTEIRVIDKSVIEEEPVNQTNYENTFGGSSSRVVDEKYEDDGDDWLKEESSEVGGTSGTSIPLGNDEDVSFSDLEEDDGDAPTNYKKTTYSSDSSTKDSRDWVQLSRSSADSAKDINTIGSERAGSEQVRGRNPETKESNDWLNVDDIDVI